MRPTLGGCLTLRLSLRRASLPLGLLFGLAGASYAADDRDTCFAVSGDRDAMLAACARYIELGRARGMDLSDAYYFRGLYLNAAGERDRALQEISEAIRLNSSAGPITVQKLTARAELYWAKGEYDRALADLDESLKLDPKRANSYYWRGLTYAKMGDYPRAAAEFQEARKLDPEDKELKLSSTNPEEDAEIVSYVSGLAYENAGELDKARADYERVLALNGAREDVRQRIAALRPQSSPPPEADSTATQPSTQAADVAAASDASAQAQAQTFAATAPAALPSESSADAGIRELFKKYGLFGRWSVLCGEYSTTDWVDARPIQQTNTSGEERLSGTVEQAIEIVPGELLVTSLWEPRLTTKLRFEGDRSRVIESTLNGLKAVEAGINLRSKVDTGWLQRCQTMPSPPAASAPGSVRQVMEKYGALGVWASDCSKPPAPANRYEVYRAMDEKFVQVDVMQSPTERDMAFIVDSAAEDGSNQLALTYTYRFRDVVRMLIERDRMRELEWVHDGKRIVEDGRFYPDKTLETPWSQKCTDLALASADSSAGNPNEGWIGVQIQGVGEDEAKGLGLEPGIKGARIIAMLDGSPGLGAMQAGDIVFAVNGENIADIQDFAGKIRAMKPGSEVALTVLRDGSKREMNIKLVARPANPSAMMGMGAPGLGDVAPATSERAPAPAQPEDPPLPADVAEMDSLAGSYAYGLSGKPQDEKEAARLYSQVADRAGPRKMAEIAGRFEIGSGVPKDLAEAARLYRKAAELGNPVAMVEIGRALDNGYGVPENDVEAIAWYRKAVDRGDARGMFYLGMAYRYGEGTKKDPAEAARWFRKAAEGGETSAMTSLAELYEAGDGVPKDDAEAARWRQAAQSDGN